ncbi:MAG: ABC transporter ATP-binding protein, partial [Thermoplasmata archaeon]
VIVYDFFGIPFITNLLTILFILPIAYITFPYYFWILFAPVPIALLTSVFVAGTIAKDQEVLNVKSKEADKVLFDSAQNIRTIKAFGREEEEAEFYAKRWTVYHEQQKKMYNFELYQILGLSIAELVLRGVILIASLYGLLDKSISIGDVVMLLTYQQVIFTPIVKLGQMYTQLRRQVSALKYLFEIIDESDTINAKERPLKLDKLKDSIEIRDVSFSYPGTDRSSLCDVSLKIERGKTVALVGRSGAGKTTLASLLTNFYAPSSGTILWDGTDITKASKDTITKEIAYVAQDSALFDRSIRENIAYSKKNASFKDIKEAARKAHAHQFIIQMPKKYDTEVGERGVRLSGGQRQRLALARALLADSSLLILDESTSQLDSESEKVIQEAVEKLRGKITQVIIAHRLSTVLNADMIVVMDAGRIVATGKHKELLKSCDIYRNLCRIQFGYRMEEEVL